MGTTKSQLITTSGNFTVPDGVTSIFVTISGGGGGGGPSNSAYEGSGSGGGSGEYTQRFPLKVTPSQVIAVTLGAGGAACDMNDGTNIPPYGKIRGFDGGDSTFGSYITVQGGFGGAAAYSVPSNHYYGRGGGINGGELPTNPGGPGVVGRAESNRYYGGSSGHGQIGPVPPASQPWVADGYGAACNGWSGGLEGQVGTIHPFGFDYRGGPGGGASCFGPGGDGGAGPTGLGAGDCTNAPPAPATSYGAGGGAAGSRWTTQSPKSGAGVKGACLVEWIA